MEPNRSPLYGSQSLPWLASIIARGGALGCRSGRGAILLVDLPRCGFEDIKDLGFAVVLFENQHGAGTLAGTGSQMILNHVLGLGLVRGCNLIGHEGLGSYRDIKKGFRDQDSILLMARRSRRAS